jgi:isopentenyldiphosphate isomerase
VITRTSERQHSIAETCKHAVQFTLTSANAARALPASGQNQPVPSDPDALVDAVDADGVVTGTTTRAVMRRDNLPHRSTAIVVLAKDGRLLAHRRARWKDVWPAHWDLAAGGVVESGEDVAESARRELAEELGIAVDLVLLATHWFRDERVQCLASVFVARHEGPFAFDDDEVSEVRWVDRADLAAMQRAGTPFCPDGLALLPLLAGHGLF